MLEIVSGPMGKTTEVLVPMERFPRGVEAYIQVEGRINAHSMVGHALEVGILSEEIIWTRPELELSAAAHSMKTTTKAKKTTEEEMST